MTPRLWPGESEPTPEPAAAPGLPTTDSGLTPPRSEPAPPPPQTSPRPADRPLTPDTAATLRAAARILRQHGWCQHVTQHPDGRLCVDGALAAAAWDATGDLDHAARLRGACYQTLTRSLGDDPIDFNDRPGTAAVDVIAALRSAARKAGAA